MPREDPPLIRSTGGRKVRIPRPNRKWAICDTCGRRLLAAEFFGKTCGDCRYDPPNNPVAWVPIKDRKKRKEG